MKKQLLILTLFLSFIIPTNAQFSQNFDAGLGMPAGWFAVNGGSAATWNVVSAGTNAHSPSNHVILTSSPTVAHNDLLVSPQINVVAGVNDRFSFWVRHTGGYSESVKVKISTTTNAVASFVDLQNTYFYSGWKVVIIDLSAYVGQSIYLGISSNQTAVNTICIDDVVNDRLVPALHSDCHGLYNLTTQAPALLNGQNPTNYTITYHTSLAEANQGLFALTNIEALDIYANDQVVIFARIYNTVTSSFTVNYFYLVNDKVSFMFFVNSYAYVEVNQGGNLGPYTIQWYNEYGIMPGQTNPILYDIWSGFTNYVVYTNTLTGCTVTSPTVYRMQLWEDNFTINFTSGAVTTTFESVLNNDMVPAAATAYQANAWPAGITINENGTINVLPNTPAGTYVLDYGVDAIDATNNISYGGLSQVTLTIPVTVDGIRMNAFLDANNNGIQEASEQDFSDGTFHYQVNAGAMHHVNTSSGEYFLVENNPANTYNLSYTLDAATNYCGAQYTISTSAYNTISVAAGSGITTYNFPITTTSCTDLAVDMFQFGARPRPGFQYVNVIYYENTSNQTIASGTITFTKSNVVSIVNISQSGTVSTADGFTYNFSNLLPNEGRYIDVTMLVPTIPTVSIGQYLTHFVTITPTDVNPSNNSYSLTQQIVGSFDPNDITEAHGDKIVHADFTSNDYLTYTIQFENTGNANAEAIRVNDVLDAKLDETTVRMVNASHGYSLDRVGNNLNWNFEDIQLAPAGKGYINFQVKPKPGYAIGDIIPNTASIFFDFNPAIVTNTFNTEFVAVLNVAEFEKGGFTVYPNPTHDWVTISLNEGKGKIDSVQVSDVLGKIVQTKSINALVATIDLSSLAKGIYFVKVTSDKQEKVMKVVRQ